MICSCSCCNNQVGSDGKIIYALKYTDDVVTLKLGEIGCILTRKILLSVFLVALNVAVLGYKIHTAQSTSHTHKYGHSHSHDQCKQWWQKSTYYLDNKSNKSLDSKNLTVWFDDWISISNRIDMEGVFRWLQFELPVIKWRSCYSTLFLQVHRQNCL